MTQQIKSKKTTVGMVIELYQKENQLLKEKIEQLELKIDTVLIKSHLEYILASENINYELKAVELLAKSGNGSLRDTITLLDQAIAYSKSNITLDMVVDMLGVINPEIIDEIFSLVLNQKKDEIKNIVHTIANYDIDSILDEIMTYLKEALFENRFSLITIERFFKIIADIKELIKINVDTEFVLTLMIFKMIEAVKPHKIDELIKEFEKGVGVNNNIQKIESVIISSNLQHNSTDLFEKLKKELYDRDIDIYKCFKDVKFISFENEVLTWESCVDEECKKILRKYWNSVIKIIIDEIFGIGTKVIPKKCSKIVEEPQLQVKKKEIKVETNHQEKIVKKAREVFGDEIVEVNVYKN